MLAFLWSRYSTEQWAPDSVRNPVSKVCDREAINKDPQYLPLITICKCTHVNMHTNSPHVCSHRWKYTYTYINKCTNTWTHEREEIEKPSKRKRELNPKNNAWFNSPIPYWCMFWVKHSLASSCTYFINEIIRQATRELMAWSLCLYHC